MKECDCKYKKHCNKPRQNSQSEYRKTTETAVEECGFYKLIKKLKKDKKIINSY